MILSSTLVAAVTATHGSRTVADMALELRKANELSAYLLETAPTVAGKTAGQTGDFAWTLIVAEPVNTFGPSAICDRRVILTGLRDSRQFEARTNTVCPSALGS